MNPDQQNIFIRNQSSFYPIVQFNPRKDKLVELDFTANNKDLRADILEDIVLFSAYIDSKLKAAHAAMGIGGYGEYREVYSKSPLFNASSPGKEPRRLHLGIDLWAPAGTPVFAPLGGMIHSFAFNNRYGDYGATLILLHQLDGFPFYTLYGHISLKDIATLQEGQYVVRAQKIAHIGEPHENGHWPPHLHFQVMYDMGVYKGDYPGVCSWSERNKYFSNCPDPDLILQLNQYIPKKD
ncbi:MAG: peptidoglycan DD-metalloendopeptidase family protein [Williamsia sp.]|nr:peptidoglycan DD-metalloendopeptidase family protein [Williamsia sp.]